MNNYYNVEYLPEIEVITMQSSILPMRLITALTTTIIIPGYPEKMSS